MAKEWSKYQVAIFKDVECGKGHTVVQAYAGSGKTTSMIEALCYVPKGLTVLMVAFNKSIAKELQARAPEDVEVATLHSFGFRAVNKSLGRQQVNQYRVHGLAEEMHGDVYATSDLRYALVKAVSLAKSGLLDRIEQIDALIDAFAIDMPDEHPRVSAEDVDDKLELAAQIRLEFCRDVLVLMEQCKQVKGEIDFDDMVWLPVVLNLRVFQYDRVFCDESQDLSPCQIELALKACKRGGRIVAIGDRHQCHPPGVRVQIDHAGTEFKRIEDLASDDTVAGWNRNAQKMVGGRNIKIAKRHYVGPLLHISAAGKEVPVTPNHKFICRWSDRTSDVCVTYLMWRKGFGFRVGWCKLFANAHSAKTFHLAHRARIEKAEMTWVLKVHTTRTEASAYESIVAARYGLPTITFEPVYGAQHLTKSTIRTIFKALSDDNWTRGVEALTDHGRDPDLPLYPWPGMHLGEIQGRRTYFKVFAANLIPELMSVPLPNNRNIWVSINRIKTTEYRGPVYSLDVEEDHSYAANGIVTLNSIYRFRGADSSAMDRIKNRLEAKELPLSICYRCATSIIRLAQQTVPGIEAAPNAPEGSVEHVNQEYMTKNVAPGEVIISRINAPLVSLCMRFIAEGRRAVIKGRDIGSRLKGVVTRSKAQNVAELREAIDSWERAETKRLLSKRPPRDTQQIEDMAMCLMAISESASNVADVIARIEELFADDDDRSRIMLSSVHKFKGLEVDRAWLLQGTFRRRVDQEESNIWYVGTTRAKTSLMLVSGFEAKKKDWVKEKS